MTNRRTIGPLKPESAIKYAEAAALVGIHFDILLPGEPINRRGEKIVGAGEIGLTLHINGRTSAENFHLADKSLRQASESKKFWP